MLLLRRGFASFERARKKLSDVTVPRRYTASQTAHKFPRPVHSFYSSSNGRSCACGCGAPLNMFNSANGSVAVWKTWVVGMQPSTVVRWRLKTPAIHIKNAQQNKKTHNSREQNTYSLHNLQVFSHVSDVHFSRDTCPEAIWDLDALYASLFPR